MAEAPARAEGRGAGAALDGAAGGGILTDLSMRRRIIYNLLTVTALLGALGTDYLAQAGTYVQAEAVVSVAEKMAARFGKAFPQRSSQPATRLESTRQTAVVTREFPATGRHDPQQARYCSKLTLHLPPPLA